MPRSRSPRGRATASPASNPRVIFGQAEYRQLLYGVAQLNQTPFVGAESVQARQVRRAKPGPAPALAGISNNAHDPYMS